MRSFIIWALQHKIGEIKNIGRLSKTKMRKKELQMAKKNSFDKTKVLGCERREWSMSPIPRVVPSKKAYSRQRDKKRVERDY